MQARLKADVIEAYITRSNISQAEFAKKGGLTAGHLSLLLAGKRNPSAATRRKLLKAVGRISANHVGFDDLFEVVGSADRAAHEEIAGRTEDRIGGSHGA